ncbi:MAG: hypothetical protein ACP5OY_04250 [Halothiobacillaceae bacterium]|jgi:hypothetical protein
MVRLEAALQALGTPDFKDVLRSELLWQDALSRPLQLGLTYGTVALLDDVKISVLALEEGMTGPRIRAAVHYSSITTGCNCSDAPNPLSMMSEYVELLIDIDRATAEATVGLAPD